MNSEKSAAPSHGPDSSASKHTLNGSSMSPHVMSPLTEISQRMIHGSNG